MQKLSAEVYRDKVSACWMGKNIGGCLGAPFEGISGPLKLEYYSPIPKEPIANDDLELQLVWLCLIEKYGLSLDHEHFAQAWRNNITYGMDEYGVAKWNIVRGLKPPLTGLHNNWFVHGMGAAIRSEIWACLFPGQPETAAHFARLDSSVDHADEGVWAEMFLAAAQSYAFIATSVQEALEHGLTVIPEKCRITQVVRFVMGEHSKGTCPSELREKIMQNFGSHNFTDCVMNLGFITLGLFCGGNDFGKTIILAVNCGMDTDCTGATSGAFMGILLGANGISKKWCLPGSDEIAISENITGLDYPTNTEQLTARVVKLSGELEKDSRHFKPDISTVSIDDEVDDGHQWLVFPINGNPFVERKEITDAEKSPLQFKDSIMSFSSIHMDMGSSCDLPKEGIYLLTSLTVPVDVDGYLMICTDGGVTAWLDEQMILNYHGRQLAIPASQRTEGGSCIPVVLSSGKKYKLKIRLLFCYAPLSLTVAVFDKNDQYIPGFEFKVG
jgi:ADP-ribosylglycohydrolase